MAAKDDLENLTLVDDEEAPFVASEDGNLQRRMKKTLSARARIRACFDCSTFMFVLVNQLRLLLLPLASAASPQPCSATRRSARCTA